MEGFRRTSHIYLLLISIVVDSLIVNTNVIRSLLTRKMYFLGNTYIIKYSHIVAMYIVIDSIFLVFSFKL